MESPHLSEPQTDSIEEVSKSKIQQVREIISGTALEQSVILVEDSGLFIETLEASLGPIPTSKKNSV